ncbi:MAG: MATE family efflux transporter [Bacilli bacterium]|nr:MATE family efflux transporter [Bacilli bacterium]
MKKLDLGKDSINQLLLSFAIPCVISMLINSVYNIVDQIFIGKGVGTLGNAATNVIFPLVLIFGAVASLIGNGTSANLSLRLGEGKKDEAKKCLGSAITVSFLVAIVIGLLSFLCLPVLIHFFGSTDTVYPYALSYGRIIAIGAPFVIIYTALSSIIRADGSPKYSMILLVTGAIVNIILDPIFIFGFNMGVEGGALATIIGQFISFVMAIAYIPKMKSVRLEKKDFKPNRTIFRVLSLGLSSFITQMIVLVLFVFMNNMLTGLGTVTKYGADIPLSVYGIVSKVNSLYISSVLGIAIGAQPIIGFNYGAGNKRRVKETLKKVLIVNFSLGILFNLLFLLFPELIIRIFISSSDPSYELFMEFAVLTCRSFLMLMALNALEMTTSVVVQSLGKVVKATLVTFIRQIILFIPLACILAYGFNKGIYGVLYASPIADVLCFIVCIFLFRSEYVKLNDETNHTDSKEISSEHVLYQGKKIVVTISREYGSGGRYVGVLLAEKMGVPFYDKELISLSAKESGLSTEYIEEIDEKKVSAKYALNNDDRLFIAESKVIRDLAKSSCVIVGRCADAILKDQKDVLKVFLYSDDESKEKRAVKYYHIDPKKVSKYVKEVNQERAKHYEYYTDQSWHDLSHYDLCINVDQFGVEKTAEQIKNFIDNMKGFQK